MSLVNKLLKKNLIDPDIKNSVITGRGNIKENFPSPILPLLKLKMFPQLKVLR